MPTRWPLTRTYSISMTLRSYPATVSLVVRDL